VPDPVSVIALQVRAPEVPCRLHSRDQVLHRHVILHGDTRFQYVPAASAHQLAEAVHLLPNLLRRTAGQKLLRVEPAAEGQVPAILALERQYGHGLRLDRGEEIKGERDPVRPQFTDHCFTGDYPTPLTDQTARDAWIDYAYVLDAERLRVLTNRAGWWQPVAEPAWTERPDWDAIDQHPQHPRRGR